MRDLGTTTISLHIGVLLGALTGHFEEAAEIHGAFDALVRALRRPPAGRAGAIRRPAGPVRDDPRSASTRRLGGGRTNGVAG